ncbi:hypothetical protein SASPL_112337 [Salvia splendens]|uniref:Uncharacterized protein n=1 Tax=Salvia splendens TaxID=180675 RepID=A0A8X8YE88_SALSN|nr:hypothetical protein SASPL_112337 [Salvia splendens]
MPGKVGRRLPNPTRENLTKQKEPPTAAKRGGARILRRGKSLSCIAAKLNGGDGSATRSPVADDMTVGRMRPERMPNQIRQSPLPLYAGSAFSLSPSPRSLPLPSFFNKKLNPSDDPATRDLRRLLRLD